MSTVDQPTPLRVRACRGYTAVEVMICVILVSSMGLVVQQTLSTADSAARYMKAVQTATEKGHNLSYDIREYVTSSRRIFFGDDTGKGFQDALDLSAAPAVDWSRLPSVDEEGRLGPDATGLPMTGNFLMFAGETDATSVVADAAGGVKRHIDTYRFHAIYVHETNRVVVSESNPKKALDLMIWESTEYPNYRQISAIVDDTERRTVVAELVGRYGYTLAWDPAGAIDNSFYAMDAAGNLSITPAAGVTIDEHPTDSRGGRLVYANAQLARTEAGNVRRQAIFTTDDPEDWQPNGFEVKVVGRSGSRQVWMHLTTEVQAALGQTATHSSTLIMATKDL